MNLETNFFLLFGLPLQFEVDNEALKSRFRHLQRQYHPDKFASSTPQEQRLAAQFSAHLNTAYAVLENPVKRAEHMATLAGVEFDTQKNTVRDISFLQQQMEYREAVSEAQQEGDAEALKRLLASASADYQACQESFALLAVEIFDLENEPSATNIANALGKLQFFEKLHAEVVQALRAISS